MYTFLNRRAGKAIRFSIQQDAIGLEPESEESLQELFEKERTGTATEPELEEFKKQRQNQIENILKLGRQVFAIQEVNISAPKQKVRMKKSINCDNCKEPTLINKIKQLNKMKLCILAMKKYPAQKCERHSQVTRVNMKKQDLPKQANYQFKTNKFFTQT